jgi:serine/threonine protein kinase
LDPNIGPGTIIGGDFRVVSPLAEGGMGAVYVALQMSTARPRALKVLRSELLNAPGIAERFTLEARVAARIRSDHVVEVIAAGWDPTLRVPWLAMELLEGKSLDAILKARGRLTLSEAAEVLRQVGAGLAAAHAAGVVHRDLKPENVFVSVAREATRAVRVKILDFGIAKVVAEAGAATSSTVAVGTPRWMSPEQTENAGLITPASDVWALGLVAYYVITGKSFWRAGSGGPGASVGQLLREVIADPIPFASARAAEQGVGALLPPSFDPWLARCLERDPRRRFPSAAEALHMLMPVLALGGPPALSPAVVMGGDATLRSAPELPFGTPPPTAAVSSVIATGPTIPAPPRTMRGKRRGLLIGGLAAAFVALATGGALVAHFQWGAFDALLEADVFDEVDGAPIEGNWAIAEGRSPGNQSYSGDVGVTRTGAIRLQRWIISDGHRFDGIGLVQHGKYFSSWSTGPSWFFVYRVHEGRLVGRTITGDATFSTATETLSGPASLEGAFQLVSSSQKDAKATLTLRKDGERYLATRTTPEGSFFGVALKDGRDLVVMVTSIGSEVGAYIYRIDPKSHGLIGTWTNSAEQGVGRELLGRR